MFTGMRENVLGKGQKYWEALLYWEDREKSTAKKTYVLGELYWKEGGCTGQTRVLGEEK